ncbi:hypothetical protein SASPL_124418 [Salvia splendens]|uniref:Uncharacterized protein n=2 Tax=Salvia splendens TaxID=180675 RepID=A0A8X8XQG5_SALSN|nr:hypothetical protein SASPL_124418 [Salvia splendens]
MFAKFNRLLDMMESRMDAVDRRVENRRRKQYPSPHQSGGPRNIPDGFLSCHPEEAANRCVGYPRAPPPPEPQPHPTPSLSYAQRTRRSYLPHSQQLPARSSSSGYTARQNANASTSGDQFMEQEQPSRQPHCVRKSPNPGWFSQESHQQKFLPLKKQTCWDLPVPRQYVRSPVSDGPPARPTRRWDLPENRVQQRVSAHEPPAPTGWPPRPQPSPVRQPSCWDPPEQQGYPPPHEPPTPVEPLDLECARFQPLPQPHRYRRDVDEDRCYGEVVTHTRSPTLDVSLGSYVSGYVNEGTNLNEVDSYLSGLDVQIAYSCSDCVDDSGKGEEELCDSKDSIVGTGAKEAMGRGVPSENRGSRESGDGRPEDQQNVRKSAIRELSFKHVEGSITLSLREVSHPASLRRTLYHHKQLYTLFHAHFFLIVRTSKMCDAKEADIVRTSKNAEFSLKVMINKEKTKVLFVEASSHFTDILLSFLTLPLGRIIKVLHKHYGDETPTIGSLNSLYHSLANLDSPHFVTEGAKQTLLNPTSSFDVEIKQLKLDITDSPLNEYYKCSYCRYRLRRLSMCYDNVKWCEECLRTIIIEQDEEMLPEGASGDGVFTRDIASFIIFDDLQIFPNETGLLGILSAVGVADMEKVEPIKVTFGFNEIMSLLKASLISKTPFSDVILCKAKGVKNFVIVGFEPETSLNQIETKHGPNSEKMSLKVVIQKSTGKLLYAQGKEDFLDFLFSFLHIPFGGIEHLLAGKTCIKAIDNLYQSTTDLTDCKYFRSPDTKNRLIKPNVVHGCISDNYILPLTQETLPDEYRKFFRYSSAKFPNGKGSYLKGPKSMYLMSKKWKCKSDFETNLSVQGLSILKASITSTSTLSDALLNNISVKQPKTEH